MYKISVAMKNTDANEIELNKLAYSLERHFEVMELHECDCKTMRGGNLLVMIIENIYKDDTYAILALIDRLIDYDEIKIGRPH